VAGFERAQERALALAAGLGDGLRARGVGVAPRGNSTLVSFEVADPPAFVETLEARERILIRSLPGTSYVRASVGGWSSEEELDRLVSLASPA
jgi:selenocysteine lyase/cysteine desulfurase